MSDEQKFMRQAIRLATDCDPKDPDKIPKVGAVIEKNGKVLAMGSRQSDTHAEKYALDQIKDKTTASWRVDLHDFTRIQAKS